jgi:hypothetical protein
MVTLAPATSFFARAVSARRPETLSTLVEPEKLTETAPGLAGRTNATVVAIEVVAE